MLMRLAGGRVIDPANGVDDVRDLFVRDGHVVAPPADPTTADRTLDLTGRIVMAGGIDVHTHVAGGNVNTARLLLPEAHRAAMDRRLNQPFATAKWSTYETGCRYAAMGFTTVVEPAMAPVQALHAHLEMADIPILDTAGLAVLGNDDFLLGLLRDRAGSDAIADYVAWTLGATRALGLKVINAGGAAAFKFNARSFDLDDEVPGYGVTSRAIVKALQQALVDLGVPHPVHVHCNNLGLAGNVETALATIAAAEGLPMHLAHVQFYGYGSEGKRGFSSGAPQLAEAVMANPNITVDVGQVLFGPTVTISSDVLRQFGQRGMAKPNKTVMIDGDANGGGIIPYTYRQKNFVNAMQWAIGLELFLLIDDPWRVFMTTDHPNGAPFTQYPHLFGLLMDAGLRDRWLAEMPKSVRNLVSLGGLRREYGLTEIAIMTRAAPAKLLGLPDRGHLAPGAAADIAVYTEQDDKVAMFSAADLVLKGGEEVVRDGAVVKSVPGHAHQVAPTIDRSIESRLQAFYDRNYALPLDRFTVPAEGIFPPDRFEVQPCRT